MIITPPLGHFVLGAFDDELLNALRAVETPDVAKFAGSVPVVTTYLAAAGWRKLSDRYPPNRPVPNMREQRERRLRWELLRDRSLSLLSREQRERVARGERSREATATSRIRP